jgi:ABC-2 type transport system ATP-binding protein
MSPGDERREAGERDRGDPAVLELCEIAVRFGRRWVLKDASERRRTCLAAALVGAPRLLVLDEPDNGLDAAGIDLLVEVLAAQVAGGGAVLLASHDRALLSRLAARRANLANGACE